MQLKSDRLAPMIVTANAAKHWTIRNTGANMGNTAPLHLRPFRPEDAETCLALFRDCVHRVNSRDYTPDQIMAWASPTIDLETWRARFNDRFAYVATKDDRIVGFSDMTRNGHLDRLFVSADHQGRGIARRLVERLLRDATDHSIEEITTDASITAKPFFLSRGFVVVKEQTIECRGVRMNNYVMNKSLRRNDDSNYKPTSERRPDNPENRSFPS